jgi:antibiotic biosynthesis monooxygenase (ABM) superfamily enzyme
MYFHIFGFKWHPEATEHLQAQAKADILAFKGKIPGLLELHVGSNQSPHGQGYTFAGVMRFTGKAAFEAYVVHPQHQALLKWLKPLIDPVELDFLALD